MSQHTPETHAQFNVQTKLALDIFEFNSKEIAGFDPSIFVKKNDLNILRFDTSILERSNRC